MAIIHTLEAHDHYLHISWNGNAIIKITANGVADKEGLILDNVSAEVIQLAGPCFKCI